jgi:hypothetical protein
VNAVMIYLPVHFFSRFHCKSHPHRSTTHVESWNAARAASALPKSIKIKKFPKRADLTTSDTANAQLL